MSVVYLISIILGVAFQNVVKKPYTQKTQGRGAYIFFMYDKLCSNAVFYTYCRKAFVEQRISLIRISLCTVVYARVGVCRNGNIVRFFVTYGADLFIFAYDSNALWYNFS